MSDAGVRDLARRVGIAVQWSDYANKRRRVPVDVLRRILAALGLPCDTLGELRDSANELRAASAEAAIPPLITATVGDAITLEFSTHGRNQRCRLILEDGTARDVRPRHAPDGRLILPAVTKAGYHQGSIDERTIGLAVAPARCLGVEDVAPASRLWGLAVQVYGLRRPGDGGIGDLSAVAALAASAARQGANAIALSPLHALLAADPSRYSPYSPSSRLFLNALHADPTILFGAETIAKARGDTGLATQLHRLEAHNLVDWPAGARAKQTVLRRLFDEFLAGELEGNHATPLACDFAEFRDAGGDLLEQHARFEALHAARLAIDGEVRAWQDWPVEWRDPGSAAVEELAGKHRRDILFHVFLQWIADRSIAAAQTDARRAGMKIGLVADLAVGMMGAGSHAWSRQKDVLVGLTVGAPPDLFNQLGQNWGLTTFSPRSLIAGGFAPFLATLRACMRHVGGLRIDHAMGLTRLWLIPDGATPSEGAYLAYPLDDLLRLVAIESHRQRAIVIGEDLGTVPSGFRARLEAAGIAGMRVLWFERENGRFVAPEAWPRTAVAMTTTHDLPTVAGWWRGVDIDTRARIGLLERGDDTAERAARDADRIALWDAFRAAGLSAAEEPDPQHPDGVVDAAVDFIACTPSNLALLPLEDGLGLSDQPNVPGTIAQHPNWRRRLDRPVDEVLEIPQVRARLQSINAYRRR